MFERIRRLYQSGRLAEAGLQEAVRRGWISREQAEKIRNGR